MSLIPPWPPCRWGMAPVCWLDMLAGCRWRWLCRFHDHLLTKGWENPA